MIKPTHRWGVLIRGHDIDIRSWQSSLVAPFVPYVSDTDFGPTLWSAAIQDLASAAEAFEAAKALVQSVNSVMFYTMGSRPVEIDGILEVREGGRLSRHVIASMAIVEMRADVVGVGLAINKYGEVVEQEPKPSRQQKWLEAAENSDMLSDLLMHGFHRDNWYEMYKALEVLEDISGGERGLINAIGPDGEKVKDLKRNANFYHRHARSRGEKPKKPMERAEARELLTRLIRQAFTLD